MVSLPPLLCQDFYPGFSQVPQLVQSPTVFRKTDTTSTANEMYFKITSSNRKVPSIYKEIYLQLATGLDERRTKLSGRLLIIVEFQGLFWLDYFPIYLPPAHMKHQYPLLPLVVISVHFCYLCQSWEKFNSRLAYSIMLTVNLPGFKMSLVAVFMLVVLGIISG